MVPILGLAIAGLAWYGMTSTGAQPLLTTDATTSGPEQELVASLLQLRAVKLDGTIFTETTFTQLQDYSTPIVPEPVGRENPFAPLAPTSSVSTAKNAQNTQIFQPPTGTRRPGQSR